MTNLPMVLRVTKTAAALLIAVLALPSTALAQAERAPPPPIGLSLFQHLAGTSPAGNIVVSPYSLNIVLAMLATGASGDTRKRLWTALGIIGETEAIRFRERKRTDNSELQVSGPFARLQTANAIWSSPKLALKPGFAEGLRSDYDAEAAVLDFAKADALSVINYWVKLKTDGAIPALVDELPKGTEFVLANAVYFKAKWLTPFAAEDTRPASFIRTGGLAQPISLMSRTGEWQYREDEKGQAVRMPYADRRFTMTVLLPRPKGKPAAPTMALLARLVRGTSYKPREGRWACPVSILTPSFRLMTCWTRSGSVRSSAVRRGTTGSAPPRLG
jgi:serine protease inhibitor